MSEYVAHHIAGVEAHGHEDGRQVVLHQLHLGRHHADQKAQRRALHTSKATGERMGEAVWPDDGTPFAWIFSR